MDPIQVLLETMKQEGKQSQLNVAIIQILEEAMGQRIRRAPGRFIYP